MRSPCHLTIVEPDKRSSDGARLRRALLLIRLQVNSGVSPRPTNHFVVAARGSTRRRSVVDCESPLVRESPPAHARGTADRDGVIRLCAARLIAIESFGISPRADAPRARAPGPRAGAGARRPYGSRWNRW